MQPVMEAVRGLGDSRCKPRARGPHFHEESGVSRPFLPWEPGCGVIRGPACCQHWCFHSGGTLSPRPPIQHVGHSRPVACRPHTTLGDQIACSSSPIQWGSSNVCGFWEPRQGLPASEDWPGTVSSREGSGWRGPTAGRLPQLSCSLHEPPGITTRGCQTDHLPTSFWNILYR